jgi:hypothetical protein
MGYACPVCDDPQADDIHLANHLAFTAISRGGDHEDWLDETVPDWGSMNEETLAEEVTDHAEEKEYPQVFEDTTVDHDHAHEHDHEHAHGRSAGTREISEAMLAQAEDELDDVDMPDTEEVVQEAREMTEKRQAEDDSETE